MTTNSEDLTTIIRGGYKVITSDTHISKWQIEEQRLDHDAFLPPLVCSHLKEGDCVLDIGAFTGDHTIAYSNAVGERGMVVAVEAGSLAAECLKHNAGLFKNKNVLVIHGAVGEIFGGSVSHLPNSLDNVGASICHEVKKEELEKGKNYLRTITIDYIASQAKRKINFIKMDIEGWEVKALIGASNVLKEERPKMLIEVNPGALEKQGDSEEDLLIVLAHHNYDWQIVQPESKLGDPMFDILCIPHELNEVEKVE